LKTSQDGIGPFYQPAKFTRYGQSKLANLLYPMELAARYPSIKSVAIHPGFVKTDMVSGASLTDRMVVTMASKGTWTTVEEGPYNQTWAATTSKENLRSGAYYEKFGVEKKPATAHGVDRELARKLWEWTQEELVAFS
jgi:NAD(P)-dependent dehydrogenase (short-subunit alcohol dehydrogenase family)